MCVKRPDKNQALKIFFNDPWLHLLHRASGSFDVFIWGFFALENTTLDTTRIMK